MGWWIWELREIRQSKKKVLILKRQKIAFVDYKDEASAERAMKCIKGYRFPNSTKGISKNYFLTSQLWDFQRTQSGKERTTEEKTPAAEITKVMKAEGTSPTITNLKLNLLQLTTEFPRCLNILIITVLSLLSHSSILSVAMMDATRLQRDQINLPWALIQTFPLISCIKSLVCWKMDLLQPLSVQIPI